MRMLIFRAWATRVLIYTYSIHGIHAWWKGVVKSKMAVTEGNTERYGCLHNIYLSNE